MPMGVRSASSVRAGQVQGAQTTEQQIRGGDKSADWFVLVNGYDSNALERLVAGELGEAAPGAVAGIYRLAYTLAK